MHFYLEPDTVSILSSSQDRKESNASETAEGTDAPIALTEETLDETTIIDAVDSTPKKQTVSAEFLLGQGKLEKFENLQ